MKLISFNVNGIRARMHQVLACLEKHQPDILGLQEIKVVDVLFPSEAIAAAGYHAEVFGQKGHYGVALLSKIRPLKVQKGFVGGSPSDQRRFIEACYPMADGSQLRVINGYFPQGDNREHPVKFPAKRQFYGQLIDYLQRTMTSHPNLVVMGDFNIAPVDGDIGIGSENAKRWLRSGKCCFLPEEREWMADLMACGLHDSFRLSFPHVDDRFSWFDYRSRGFEQEPKRGLRIDLLLVSSGLVERIADVGLDYEIRGMEKPSDHAPAWLQLKC